MVEPHEHTWEEPRKKDIEVEDGSIYVMLSCTFAEVIGAQTSDRLDETFYEYGAECEATRFIRYDMTDLYDAENDEHLDPTDPNEVPEDLFIPVESAVRSYIVRNPCPEYLGGDEEIGIWVTLGDSGTFRAEYTLEVDEVDHY